MRHHRKFGTEAEAREFARLLSEAEAWDLIPADQIAVSEHRTLFAQGEVFEEGHWSVSWIQYTL